MVPNIIYSPDVVQHSHGVHTDTSLVPVWASMSTPSAPSMPSRAPPMPVTRLTVPRAHPYRKRSSSYNGRGLSRSPSAESSSHLSASYSTSSQPHTMAHNIQGTIPTIMLNDTPATHLTTLTPRRVRVPQTAEIKPSYTPTYSVQFKINDVRGFRIGDALNDPNFFVDDGNELVLENCPDRQVHLLIDVRS